MLPAKAAGSLEKSCGREQLSKEGTVVHDGCMVEHLISLQLLNLFVSAHRLQQSFPSSKFLILLEVSQAIQFRKALESIAFVVTGGLVGKRLKHCSGEAVETLQPSNFSSNKQVDSVRGSWELLA